MTDSVKLSAAVLPGVQGDFDLGLYDSDTGQSLVAEKIVDATGACRSGERTILLYTRAQRGPIVQILHPYEGCDYGTTVHYFIDEIPRRRAPDDGFQMWADRAGLSRTAFLRLIKANAP